MSDSDYVVIHTASGYMEAKLLAGLLEAEGIAARVPGSELTDEVGMARKLVAAADVVVPGGDVERARDIVAAWKESKTPTDDAGDAPAG
ncbi:MAG: DUF2007 domain-containing protein [Planctomycetota bacterium]